MSPTRQNNLALKAAGTIFLLVSVMHLLRVLLKFELIVAGYSVPAWFNLVGFVFSLLLSSWMFKSAKEKS